MAQVAEALDYAHLKGIVHRDLKPSNVMVLPDGTAKVMDFGIARARRYKAAGLTVTGAFLGSPDYVAPEAAEGRPTDARTDLYALGVVFYEVLTGRRPFAGDTPFAILKRHCTEPPVPPSQLEPSVPPRLQGVVLRGIPKAFAGHVAVKDLSLEVPRHSIYGLLGPNGAGKTTTLKMIYGFLRPTSGSIHVGGTDVTRNPAEARAAMGIVPQEDLLDPDLDITRNLGCKGRCRTGHPANR